MKYLLLVLIATSSLICSAQTDDKVYTFVEVMPEFPGKGDSLINFIKASIVYPQADIENKIQGKVIVQFVITEEGKPVQAKILRNLSPTIDAEALRLISILPNFEPGRQQGKAVKVYYTMPIVFALPTAAPVATTPKADSIYAFADIPPVYNGGWEKIPSILGKSIVYPAAEKKAKVEGKVMIQFVIDKEGKITEPTVLRSVSPAIDAEALRVINLLPPFTSPGKLKDGTAVRTYFTLQVVFKL
jgi:TonB family protein